MAMTVSERAQTIATFRFIEVRLMEVTAAWTPTTPEMEVKVLFGRHIWDFAQHADALGKRTFELRLPEQASRRPTDAYVSVLEEMAAHRDTAHRLGALYDVVLPGMERRYRSYIQRTDALLDQPSVIVLDRILADLSRQRREADDLRRELGVALTFPEDLRRRDGALETVLVGE